MSRVRKTSRTSPRPLCMWKLWPSAVHDAGRILAAMLQDREPVVEELVDRAARDDSDDSAHASGVLQDGARDPAIVYALCLRLWRRVAPTNGDCAGGRKRLKAAAPRARRARRA